MCSQGARLGQFKQGGREGTCTAACCVLEDHCGKQRKYWGCLNGESGTEHNSLKAGSCVKDKKSEANDRFVIPRHKTLAKCTENLCVSPTFFQSLN